ncbi:MAG: GNAT family N-acetyltransferase [Sphingobacteriia bacterium]|nr:GNAT family N-acetyltransferase [Sphingobacteriia bacterium]
MQIREIHIDEALMIRKEVMYPNKAVKFAKIENDDEGKHYGLFNNNQLISVVSIFIKNNELQFRKFATLKPYQNKGLGTKLLEFVFQFAIEHHCTAIWCNARKNAIGLYKRFGMLEIGEPYLQNDIEYIQMKKEL